MPKYAEKEVVCTFTGHRPESLPWGSREEDPRCLDLKSRLQLAVWEAYDLGYRHFICGMARGGDFYFCEAVQAMAKQGRPLTLEAAVPFPKQPDLWPRRDQRRYFHLLAGCTYITYTAQAYSDQCMYRRNHYMVDHASRLIAIYNGSPQGGGTLSTINYALLQGIDVDILDI